MEERTLLDIFEGYIESLEAQGEDTSEYTVWDIFVSLIGDIDESYILILKSDMEILYLIAGGMSVKRVSDILDISSKSVFDAVNTWGITPLRTSLTVDAFNYYTDDVTLSEFSRYIGKDSKTVDLVLDNIGKYLDLVEFLKENDRQ